MGNPSAAGAIAPPRTWPTWLALAFVMTFPSAAAWTYFVGLARSGNELNPAQQSAYLIAKFVQFSFPVVFLMVMSRPWPRLVWPGRRGMALGVGFGVLVAAVILAAYYGLLRNSSLLAHTPAQLHRKLSQVGLASPGRYAALAGFIVVGHALLEEYYWRWFVFGWLRTCARLAPAVALSSLAFMAHHVVLLGVYLPGRSLAVLLLALAIAVGGAVWAWLYDRAGTLYPSWLSHVIADAAIFVIGWDMLSRATGG
jgi:membrane protease YdiL (CAAX protease family)